VGVKGTRNTYIEQKFTLDAIFGLFFQEDVTDGVYDEHLAVLGNNALLRSLGTRGDFSLDGGADASDTRGPCTLGLLALLALLVHGTLFAAVPWHESLV
jgi:hypothetical protein